MPPCDYTLRPPQTPVFDGASLTFRLDPPLKPGCVLVSVSVNGREVKPGDERGGLHATGFGGTGEISFRATQSDPVARVAVTVRCETCGPTRVEADVPRVMADAGGGDSTAETVLKTIFLPLSVALGLISGAALFLCWLLGLIPKALGAGWDCSIPEDSLDKVYDALPDWLRRLIPRFWR